MSALDPRRTARARLRAASVALVTAAPLLALVDLRGAAAVVAGAAAAVVLVFQTLHVTRGSVGQAVPAVVALAPWVVGPGGGAPRLAALIGAVAVLAGAEVARVAADQGAVPLESDPPDEAVRALGPLLAAAAAAGAGVLLLAFVHLDSAGVLVALGATAAVVVAATLAHPRSMLGRLAAPAEEAESGAAGDEVSPPRAARGAAR